MDVINKKDMSKSDASQFSSNDTQYLGALAKAECVDNVIGQDDVELIFSTLNKRTPANEKMIDARRSAQLLFV